jgi:hypothetical protein
MVGIVDDERDRLRRVPGSLEHVKAHARTELDRVSGCDPPRRVLGLAALAVNDLGADAVAQLEMAGDEVRMEVREDRVSDPQTVRGGIGQVLIDVTLGVDDSSHPAALVRHEVGRVGEATEVVLLEDHLSKCRGGACSALGAI